MATAQQSSVGESVKLPAPSREEEKIVEMQKKQHGAKASFTKLKEQLSFVPPIPAPHLPVSFDQLAARSSQSP